MVIKCEYAEWRKRVSNYWGFAVAKINEKLINPLTKDINCENIKQENPQ
jgi:hypothetical protein